MTIKTMYYRAIMLSELSPPPPPSWGLIMGMALVHLLIAAVWGLIIGMPGGVFLQDVLGF